MPPCLPSSACAAPWRPRPSPSRQQLRHATLLRRPRRPYTFTQLVTLSDGSAFVHRTTSPMPIYRSNKDVRNSALWNPSSQRLLNIEEDEAGRLRAFRARFGRGWDAADGADVTEAEGEQETVDAARPSERLVDLISGYARRAEDSADSSGSSSAATDGDGMDSGVR